MNQPHRGIALRRVKLQQASRTSALLSGFALVAMVELDLPEGRSDIAQYDDDPVIVAFAIVTALLISVHLFALMVSTCILPYLDMEHDRWLDEIEYMEEEAPLPTSQTKSQDRHHFSRYIEMAWIFATGLGIFLFLIDLALLSHLKFVNHSPTAAWCVIGLLVPVAAIFAWFASRFYSTVVLSHTRELGNHVDHLNHLHRLAHALDSNEDDFQSPRNSMRPRQRSQRPSVISHQSVNIV
eukprot:TRINITY_DN11536_c0_g1_i1.p2 TRINITY_DN11536_c0_g1~~TRINITY_DN11536_c0_g1_i1.p2  ORF type:complete len:239 (+),score=47.02 TRINITY_DN11536_c0_g1_i1:3852-4568(+)